MVDLGIPRIHEYQNTLPGVKGGRGIQGDKSSHDQSRSVPAQRKHGDGQDKNVEELPVNRLKVPETAEEFAQEVKELNQLLGNKTQIRFRVNQETRDIYVEIVDAETNKILKTIPREEVPLVKEKVRNGSFLVDSKS